MPRFLTYPRIRKKIQNPNKFIRLHRAEFGHDVGRKRNFKNNYYPNAENLIIEISKFYKKKKENILLGLGGESLIKDAILWHQLKFNRRISLNTYPNFFMYEIFLKIFNYKKFYFKIDAFKPEKTNSEKIIKILKNKKITLLIIVNPAHPIEKYWTNSEINKILNYAKKKKIFVIIDEVYQGMGAKSCINLIENYDNFIVIKSFSKTFGYPGLRIGFAIGHQNIIKQIESFRLSQELPSDIIDKGIDLFKNYKRKVAPRIKKIINARNFAIKEFKKRNKIINGGYGNSLSVYFQNKKLLLKIGKSLKKNKIIVNYEYPKPYDNFLNITTSSKPNLKKFFKILDKYDTN